MKRKKDKNIYKSILNIMHVLLIYLVDIFSSIYLEYYLIWKVSSIALAYVPEMMRIGLQCGKDFLRQTYISNKNFYCLHLDVVEILFYWISMFHSVK